MRANKAIILANQIYLDYAATIQCRQKAKALCHRLTLAGQFASPAFLKHNFGEPANKLVKNANWYSHRRNRIQKHSHQSYRARLKTIISGSFIKIRYPIHRHNQRYSIGLDKGLALR